MEDTGAKEKAAFSGASFQVICPTYFTVMLHNYLTQSYCLKPMSSWLPKQSIPTYLFQPTSGHLCVTMKEICCSSDTRIYTQAFHLNFPIENFPVYFGFDRDGSKSQEGVLVKTEYSQFFIVPDKALYCLRSLREPHGQLSFNWQKCCIYII